MRTSRTARTAAVALTLLCAVGATAGCADSGGRRTAVSDVAVRLLTAVRDRDGDTACRALAPDTAAGVSKAAGKACAEAVLDDDLPAPASVTHVDVYGQWARVVLADDTVFLAAFPGGWLVVAAGCHSRGDRPYDCTVQGG